MAGHGLGYATPPSNIPGPNGHAYASSPEHQLSNKVCAMASKSTRLRADRKSPGGMVQPHGTAHRAGMYQDQHHLLLRSNLRREKTRPVPHHSPRFYRAHCSLDCRLFLCHAISVRSLAVSLLGTVHCHPENVQRRPLSMDSRGFCLYRLPVRRCCFLPAHTKSRDLLPPHFCRLY